MAERVVRQFSWHEFFFNFLIYIFANDSFSPAWLVSKFIFVILQSIQTLLEYSLPLETKKGRFFHWILNDVENSFNVNRMAAFFKALATNRFRDTNVDRDQNQQARWVDSAEGSPFICWEVFFRAGANTSAERASL